MSARLEKQPLPKYRRSTDEKSLLRKRNNKKLMLASRRKENKQRTNVVWGNVTGNEARGNRTRSDRGSIIVTRTARSKTSFSVDFTKTLQSVLETGKISTHARNGQENHQDSDPYWCTRKERHPNKNKSKARKEELKKKRRKEKEKEKDLENISKGEESTKKPAFWTEVFQMYLTLLIIL